VTTELRITKGHGTGNDFVLLTDVDASMPLPAEQVAALADRHFGVGGDGLLRAVRSAALGEPKSDAAAAAGAEWFMDYRNADGSLAEICGNGVRVFVRYLVEEGLAPQPEAGDDAAPLLIGTRAGVVEVRSDGNGGYEVLLGTWRLDPERTVRAEGLSVPRPGLGIDVGNPHVVVALAEHTELEALELERLPDLDPLPPAGANIEFVVPAEPLVQDGVSRIRMRVYERGVGETLSCGTGAVAAALATRHWAGAGAPDRWQVTVPGGTLGVRVVPQPDGSERVALSGPAELVFRGTVLI